MPNHSSRAIANEFIRRRGGGAPNQMWLQKLVYMANGWNLAINGEPLVADSAEAWDGGPVYRPIWNHIRDYGYVRPSCFLEDPTTRNQFAANLTPNEARVIDLTWQKYNGFSGHELSRMTHLPGTPWTETYMTRGRDAVIPTNLIREHYLNLARAGRAA